MPLTPRTIITTMHLETERLLLRLPQAEDLDAYAELFADPEVVRYTGGVTKNRTESKVAIERMVRHWRDPAIGPFRVVRKKGERGRGRAGVLRSGSPRWVD